MATNLFNRTLRITLFDVESNPDGTVTQSIPLVARDYVISPFNLEDIDAVERWIRQQTLDRFIETAKLIEGLSRDEFLELVGKETRRVSAIGWTTEESMHLLSTVDGLSFLIFRSLYKGVEEGIELTPENLKIMLQCPRNQAEAVKAIKRLDSLDAWGVSHPTDAQSPGQEMTTTEQMTAVLELVQNALLKDSSGSSQSKV